MITPIVHAAENSVLGGPQASFHVWSNDLTNHGYLPEDQVLNGFGRHGRNISPHLAWADAPAGTESFVVTVYDPDAPTGSGWWHWVVVNIPKTTKELSRGAGNDPAKLPPGALQTLTDFGEPGYGGAAPPAGEVHRYIFTVYALRNGRLNVNAGTTAAMVGFLVHGEKLASASLTVTYGP